MVQILLFGFMLGPLAGYAGLVMTSRPAGSVTGAVVIALASAVGLLLALTRNA